MVRIIPKNRSVMRGKRKVPKQRGREMAKRTQCGLVYCMVRRNLKQMGQLSRIGIVLAGPARRIQQYTVPTRRRPAAER